MDVFTHFLIGLVFALYFRDYTILDRSLMIFFSILPDLIALIPHTLIGIKKNRWLFIARVHDFDGATINLPNLMGSLYFFPHSLVFLLLLLPFMLILNLNLYLCWFYVLHILIDVFSHKGEWRTKIFYPVSNLSLEGFVDAFRFSWREIIYTWSLLSFLVLIIYTIS